MEFLRRKKIVMKIGYVVLYVTDPTATLKFWIEKFGMAEKGRKEAGSFSIVRVGFPDQDFAFELVPLELMQNNPAGLNLGAPSIALYVSNLEEARANLVAQNIECSEIADHGGVASFAFPDNEDRWFAVLKG
jgi:catechol 2,3-dioxygenase-like lactoylglutathione lyase family enzyme